MMTLTLQEGGVRGPSPQRRSVVLFAMVLVLLVSNETTAEPGVKAPPVGGLVIFQFDLSTQRPAVNFNEIGFSVPWNQELDLVVAVSIDINGEVEWKGLLGVPYDVTGTSTPSWRHVYD